MIRKRTRELEKKMDIRAASEKSIEVNNYVDESVMMSVSKPVSHDVSHSISQS